MAPRESHNPKVSHVVHDERQQSVQRVEKTEAEPVQTAQATVAEAPASAQRSGEYILPPAVISRADIGRCAREIESISDYFHQAGLRGSKDQPLPTLSRTLESLATANGMNLIHAQDRDKLKSFLVSIKSKAPSVHMSFPSEASDDFVAKLLDWFRTQVHPHVVLNVGLQPELAAGCTLRTTNKFYDFSFRARFEASKAKLLTALEELDAKAGPLEVPVAEATTEPTPAVTETTQAAETPAPAAVEAQTAETPLAAPAPATAAPTELPAPVAETAPTDTEAPKEAA